MRILTVDDNAIIRIGLRAALEVLPDVTTVLDTADPAEAERTVAAGEVDVVLLDVQMPARSGLDLLPLLAAHVPVVMLTHRDDHETLEAAMSAGASGYLVHGALGPQEMLGAIRVAMRGSAVVAGAVPRWGVVAPQPAPSDPPAAEAGAAADEVGLSEREAEVMAAIAQGLGNAEIAADLFLAPKTVKNNVNRIFAKLGVRTRAQAIVRWQELCARPTREGSAGGGPAGPGRP